MTDITNLIQNDPNIDPPAEIEKFDVANVTVKPGMEQEWLKAVAKNQDGYGHGVVEATHLCCAALDAGKSPEDASHAADGLGITGFMAGCMAQWVSHFHPRGEEFRKWWNLDTQIGTEGEAANAGGEVLNPALITIG